MNENQLRERLQDEFAADEEVVDAVVEQALQLDRSGEFEEVTDRELTEDFLAEKLSTAQRPLKDSWNWYLGRLDYFYDDFRKYQIDDEDRR